MRWRARHAPSPARTTRRCRQSGRSARGDALPTAEPLGARQHEVEHALIGFVDVRGFSITGTSSRLRAHRRVVLDPPDLVEAVEVAGDRANAVRWKCRGRRSASRGLRGPRSRECSARRRPARPRAAARRGRERDGRPRAPSTSPPRARGRARRRTPASTFRDWSRKPAIAGSSGLLGLAQRLPGLEAREVDRGHEVAREERAHRLTDEVRGRHARDPEAVGELGRNAWTSRCPSLRRAGRSPAGRARRSAKYRRRPAHRGVEYFARAPRCRSRSATVSPRARRSSSTRRARSCARIVGNADRRERASHQPLRVRNTVAAERQRLVWRGWLVTRAPALGRRLPRARAGARRGRPRPRRSRAARAGAPRSAAASATTSIAAAFSSTRIVSASTLFELRAQRVPVGKVG